MANDMSAPATSSPSSSPTPSSPTSADTGGAAPSGFDVISNATSNDPDMSFDGLGQDFDESLETLPADVPVPPTPAVAPAPVAPVAAVPPTPQVPAAPTAPSATPAVAPAATAEPPAPATEQTPTDVPPADVDGMLEMFNTRAADLMAQFVPQFQLTPEQTLELETDAAQAVPKLLAQTYMKSMQSALSLVKTLVPQMVQQTIQKDAVGREMETQFFKQWSQLDKAKHGKDISMYARMFSQTNPQMTQAELFSLVGAAVVAKNGLAAAPASAAPMATQPFSPSVNSAPVVHSQPVDASNAFAGMGFNFDDD